MGGTFDPPHIGHLVCADEARWAIGLDRVWFVPAGEPWHKKRDDVSDPQVRLDLVTAAVADDPWFKASSIDVDRDGPTYTYDTLSAARRMLPDAELFFITGADALATIMEWDRADELFELATFVGASRAGAKPVLIEGRPFEALEIPALSISSTDIRLRVREGRPWRYLVPEPVADEISRRGLYR